MAADWIAEVTRTVRLAVPAASFSEATDMASALAWEWLPEAADGGDQGTVSIRIVRPGDLPGDGSEGDDRD
jgi:hypothetical protein